MGIDLTNIASPDFWFGFVGALLVTAFMSKALISFVMDKMHRVSLKTWEKIGCTLFTAFLVAIAWNLYATETIQWRMLFANTLVYTFASSFIYENVIKKLVAGNDSA